MQTSKPGVGTARPAVGGSLDRGRPWPAARPPHGRRAGPGVWLILARGAAGLVSPAVLRERLRWAWIVTLVGVPRTLRGVGCRCVCWGCPPPGRWSLQTPLLRQQPRWSGPSAAGWAGHVCRPLGPQPFREGARARAASHTRLVLGVWGAARARKDARRGREVRRGGLAPGDSTDVGAPGSAEGGRSACAQSGASASTVHGPRGAQSPGSGSGGRRAGSNHAVLRSGHQPLHRRAAPHRVVRQDLAGEAALLDPHAGRRARAAAVR